MPLRVRLPLRSLLLLLFLSPALACHGPFGLLPGGSLEGETSVAPETWAFAGDSGTAQLETLHQAPYSVNLAFTILDDQLYVNAGDTETQWVKNMQTDPDVRLRVDGTLYPLRAVRVTDENEIRAFGEAWTSQSFFRRDPRKYDEVWIYKLVAR
jgi:hypothetical protein